MSAESLTRGGGLSRVFSRNEIMNMLTFVDGYLLVLFKKFDALDPGVIQQVKGLIEQYQQSGLSRDPQLSLKEWVVSRSEKREKLINEIQQATGFTLNEVERIFPQLAKVIR